MEKLDFLVRFWELRARYEAIGIPLTKSERFELLSLMQLVASEDEPCLICLAPDGLPSRSQFTVPKSGLWRSPLRIGTTGERVVA